MGLKTALMGKPPQPASSESGNHAYDSINKSFSPGFDYFTKGGDMLGNMLGVGGGPAQTDALNNFANSGGMQFLMDQGQKMVTSSKAAQGLLKSGSYGTALEKYGQGLASTYLNQFLDHLTDYSKLGLGAGSLVSSAGQYSTQEGAKPAKQGILPTLLQVGSAAATGGAPLGASGGLGAMLPMGLDTGIADSLSFSGGSPLDVLSGAGYPSF
jgi:hypothetical protein